jgi:hypothetical protein
VEEVRWDNGGHGKSSGLEYFSRGKEKKIVRWEQDYLCTTE